MKKVTFRLPTDLDKMLGLHAVLTNTSRREILTRALQQYLTQKGKVPAGLLDDDPNPTFL